MCGICGVMHRGAARRHAPQVQRMSELLDHRGPDDSGMAVFDDAVLGHRRLSIIDPRNGAQPMWDDDGSVCITFNGEIYGHDDLRRELQARGVAFRTRCDTELVLKLYLLYGEEMLARLPGAFAFAIWDNRTGVLFCARDRMGEKPLYFARGLDGAFYFASEVKAILRAAPVDTAIERRSLIHYLDRGYVAPGKGIFRGIQPLPPASWLTFDGHDVKVERYWSPPPANDSISLSAATEEFHHLLSTAVRKQMIADVDVSFFLSGGLDSSALVTLASTDSPSLCALNCIGAGSDSEEPFAREVAERAGVKLEVVRTDPNAGADLLLKLASVYDEPFWDSSAPGVFTVCAAAAKRGKVIVSGDGADELLGGYSWWYRPIAELDEIRSGGFAGTAAALLRRSRRPRSALRLLQRLRSGLSPRALREQTKWSYAAADWRSLGFSGAEVEEVVPVFADLSGDMRAMLNNEIDDYLPGNMMVKVDRASMANSLEVRCPFLDRDVVEFVSALPADFRVTSSADKILLRESFAHALPRSVLDRPKQGFGVQRDPLDDDPSLVALYRELVEDPSGRLAGLVDIEGVRRVARQRPPTRMAFLVLACWAEQTILGSSCSAPPPTLSPECPA